MNRRLFCVSFWRQALDRPSRSSASCRSDASRFPGMIMPDVLQAPAFATSSSAQRGHLTRIRPARTRCGGAKLLKDLCYDLRAFCHGTAIRAVALLYRNARLFLIASNPMDAIVKKEGRLMRPPNFALPVAEEVAS